MALDIDRVGDPMDNSSEDRLSKLPDDVLLDILDRMDTTTAIRTGVLSKRMCKLPSKLSRINIDMSCIGTYPISQVIEQVTRARMNPEAVPIRDLRVSFVLRHPECVYIGWSVARAMAAGKVTGAAEFDIITEKASGGGGKGFFLLGGLLTKLLTACAHTFAGLTKLSLRHMMFGERDVPGILAACGRLESLSFHHCAGLVLRLEHGRLANLEIASGMFKRVELCSLPRLRRMRCDMTRLSTTGPCICFNFSSVPRLSELSLADNWTSLVDGELLELSQLLVNASSVSDLRLDFGGCWIWVAPERPERLAPLLVQLRVLSLDNLPQGHDIAWTMLFLEAAPTLEDLRIKMGPEGCYNKMDVQWNPPMPGFKHRNLAKLTIHGFQANDVFLGYISLISKAATNIIGFSLHDMEGRRYNNTRSFEIS